MVYNITCEGCDNEYIGETEGSLRTCFMEHRRPSTTTLEVFRYMYLHMDCPVHTISLEGAKILDTEPCNFEECAKSLEFTLVSTRPP